MVQAVLSRVLIPSQVSVIAVAAGGIQRKKRIPIRHQVRMCHCLLVRVSIAPSHRLRETLPAQRRPEQAVLALRRPYPAKEADSDAARLEYAAAITVKL